MPLTYSEMATHNANRELQPLIGMHRGDFDIRNQRRKYRPMAVLEHE